MSGFSIFFGVFVAALLAEWGRIEILRANRERSRRRGKPA